MLCFVCREVVDSSESLFSCVQAFFLQHNSVLLKHFFFYFVCGMAYLQRSEDHFVELSCFSSGVQGFSSGHRLGASACPCWAAFAGPSTSFYIFFFFF